jgi:TetR/AcrR family transcriptional regulator, regulator of cefoperazone and chloramphenicol sensitivity
MDVAMAVEGERRGQEKRRRLLEAAGEVFAERGFKGATIQEISQRANANIASVNYHFRDKETLYHEVFRYALSQSRDAYNQYPADETERRPAQRLRNGIYRSVKSMFRADRAPWQPMIFFREMLEPTSVLDSLIEENMRPHQHMLGDLVRDLLPDADDHVIHFCALAINALCSNFQGVEKYIKRLYPDDHFGAESADELAELITRFVLGAIKGLRAPAK